MKSTLFILIFAFFLGVSAKAQIKIGNNPQNIDASSILELESNSKVLVITRINTAEMNTITPNQGALIYNIDTQCIHYYNNTSWVNLCESADEASNFTTDPIVNAVAGTSTIIITPTTDGHNFEVALNSIQSDQIQNGGIIGADIQDNAVTSAKIFDGTISTDDISNKNITPIKIQPALIDPITPIEKVLSTDTNGNVVWIGNTSTNLAKTNLTQTATEDRNYDLNGQKLTFSGTTGSSVGIGNFGGSQPVQSTDKLDVNGQIRARGVFAANPGTVGEPSYGFYTDGDTDTGIYRAGPNQIGISTNGTDAIRIDASQNVGIGTILPSSTLHTGGSFATAIDREISPIVDLTTNNLQHTIILDPGVTNVILPASDGDTKGRIYIIKNNSGVDVTTNIKFRESDGSTTTVTILAATVVWLQSDGLGEWEQIN